MLAAIENLVPVFLLLVIGFAMLRTGLVPAEGWVGLERLLYYVAFPALIVASLAKASFSGASAGGLVLAMLGAQAVVAGVAIAARPLLLGRFGGSRPGFTSVMQGVVRWNTLVALAVIGSLFGAEAVSLAAFGLAVMIPVANVVSVATLAVDGAPEAGRTDEPLARLVARQLATNPLVIAVAVGLLISLTGLALPKILRTTLDLLGQASIATGVLVVGAGLDPRQIRPDGTVMLATLLKLVVTPALMIGFGVLAGVEGLALSVLAVCGAVPTASASYVLARRMGGDAPLMARIVATQTAIAILTMPAALWLATRLQTPG
ncbi:AEC family transporter [Prosthecomicrobium sp. N25]|uniref:AEC family transporter n=1 Tax=Prosthecomicrobium sp. N25 TaxID=3129254 RepID=UPI003077021F